MTNEQTPHNIAKQKMIDGTLMSLDDVAALFAVSPSTVHRLNIPSIRLGRSLRFSPTDVGRFIDAHKEPQLGRNTDNDLNFIFLGTRFHFETSGVMPYLALETPLQRVEWSDVTDAIHTGRTVTIRPAPPLAIAYCEESLQRYTAQQSNPNNSSPIAPANSPSLD